MPRHPRGAHRRVQADEEAGARPQAQERPAEPSRPRRKEIANVPVPKILADLREEMRVAVANGMDKRNPGQFAFISTALDAEEVKHDHVVKAAREKAYAKERKKCGVKGGAWGSSDEGEDASDDEQLAGTASRGEDRSRTGRPGLPARSRASTAANAQRGERKKRTSDGDARPAGRGAERRWIGRRTAAAERAQAGGRARSPLCRRPKPAGTAGGDNAQAAGGRRPDGKAGPPTRGAGTAGGGRGDVYSWRGPGKGARMASRGGGRGGGAGRGRGEGERRLSPCSTSRDDEHFSSVVSTKRRLANLRPIRLVSQHRPGTDRSAPRMQGAAQAAATAERPAALAKRPAAPTPHNTPSANKLARRAIVKSSSLRANASGSAMAPKLVGAIDQGTTSTRFILYRVVGDGVLQPLASHQMEHKQIYPKPGWCEHRSGGDLRQRPRRMQERAFEGGAGEGPCLTWQVVFTESGERPPWVVQGHGKASTRVWLT